FYVLADQLGVPIPAAPVLIAAGGLAAAGRLSLAGVVGLSVLATLIADLAWYGAARVRGAKGLGLLCRISLEPDSWGRPAEDAFLRCGLRFLLFREVRAGPRQGGPAARWRCWRRCAAVLLVQRGRRFPLDRRLDGLGLRGWRGGAAGSDPGRSARSDR